MFFNVFDSCVLVFILKVFKFTSSVLFETNILFDKSLSVSKLLLHLSKIPING